MAKELVNIICMKWGDKYGADYVNRLYGMVSRNLTIPFQFVCFTENKKDIHPNVKICPLPSLGLPDNIPERGWLKLATFQKPLADLKGTALFLDLDVVIVDNIDCFFEFDAEFAVCFDEKKKAQKVGNTSVYRFEIGKHEDILGYFLKNFDAIKSKYRNEQAYLSDQMNQKQVLKFWPKDWTPSFKYHCVPKFPFNFWQAPFIPEGAKIILFHGKPEPYEAEKGVSGKWYRYFKPVSWITKYWTT
ncbi:MAG: glycosyltransferase [Cocleimonas sp.]|nr:glycosyltransferase [Cocleimonas sp.]